MDDLIKFMMAFAGIYVLFKLTEQPEYVAPYYTPWYFPWISNRFLSFPQGGFARPPFSVPRPPLGDGEGMETGEMFSGGGHGGGHGR